jgi:hypothetical protein
MVWNNRGKVSNLTVGHHSFIPFTLHHEQGAPTFYGNSAAARGYLTPITNQPFLYRLAAAYEGYLTMNRKHYKLNKRNSKILHDTMVSLGALKGAQSALQEMHINEIQVHILDEEGDGVILCLEYDESTGELKKTFSCVDEFYDDTVEVELEGDDTEDENALFDEEYYGGRTNFTVEVLDDVSAEAESSFIEEAISEEYDEVFHKSRKPPGLLN